MVEVVMLLVGIYALIKGKLPFCKNAKHFIEAKPARIIGAICILPAPLSIGATMAVAAAMAASGRAVARDSLFWVGIGIELSAVIVCAVAAGVVARIYRKPMEGTSRPPEFSDDAGHAPDDTRNCPMCGEPINATARKCRFCGEDIVAPTSVPTLMEAAMHARLTSAGMLRGALVGTIVISIVSCGGLGILVGGFHKLGPVGIMGVIVGPLLGAFVGSAISAIRAARRTPSGITPDSSPDRPLE
jgi:uncharacterized protein YqgC (DUF456 family)